MNKLKLLAIIKFLLVVGVTIFIYHNSGAAEKKISDKTSLDSSDKSDKKDGLPEIPKGDISPEDGLKLREELDRARRDIENKLLKLQQSRKTYESLKVEVGEKLKKAEEERRLLEETLQREKKIKEERLTEALEFIAKMEPRKSAAMLEAMDRDLVIHLLRKLPPRQVTKMLENVSAKKATEFMEYYTKIRSGREYELLRELGLCSAEAPDDNQTPKTTPTRTPGDPTKAGAG